MRVPMSPRAAMAWYLFWRLYEGRVDRRRFAALFDESTGRSTLVWIDPGTGKAYSIATIDGVQITRGSNVISDAVDGLTFTLVSKHDLPTDVTIFHKPIPFHELKGFVLGRLAARQRAGKIRLSLPHPATAVAEFPLIKILETPHGTVRKQCGAQQD